MISLPILCSTVFIFVSTLWIYHVIYGLKIKYEFENILYFGGRGGKESSLSFLPPLPILTRLTKRSFSATVIVTAEHGKRDILLAIESTCFLFVCPETKLRLPTLVLPLDDNGILHYKRLCTINFLQNNIFLKINSI